MAIQAQRVAEVAVDQRITSTQHNQLMRAGNDRLRPGLDGAWRILFYDFNLVRQVRKPDATGFVWPSQAEMLKFFGLIRPSTGFEWPVADPGDPEGANLANPLMAFKHGNPAVYPENVRLENVMTQPSETPADRWMLGILQRGYWDPVSGQINAPATAAGQSHWKIGNIAAEVWLPSVNESSEVVMTLSGSGSPIYGKSFGGYLPASEEVGLCDDATQTTPATPIRELLFTALREGVSTNGTNDCTTAAALVYQTACPLILPGDQPDKVFWVVRTKRAYYVYKGVGVDVLPRTDYMAGPYCFGGRLAKDDGDQLNRIVLGAFLKDFRGTATNQLDPSYNIEDVGFDEERFLNSQYFLSPNIGHLDEGSPPLLVPDYPAFVWSGAVSFAVGSMATYGGGGSSHAYAEGFVLGGCYLVATGLVGSVTVEILSGTEVLREVTLTADAEHNAELQTWFESATSPQPLKFRLKTALAFTDDTGELAVECTEQWGQKPEVDSDAYLVLRLAATTGSEISDVDGSGEDTTTPKNISDDYFAYGCILNRLGADGLPLPGAQVNNNAGYDAARRLIMSHLRVVDRSQLKGYAVVGGKSVLWFDRHYTQADATVDSFEDIAPPEESTASGSIEEGIEYVVLGTGSVTYDGTAYVDGEHFTATATATYTPDGDARPWVYDGIRSVAPPKGQTNEWLMFAQHKLYHTANDNLWKPDAYANYFLLNERCQTVNPEIGPTNPNRPELLRHVAYGIYPALAPEMPTGWRYVDGTNGSIADPDTKRRFHLSCRVYEPDSEIESVVTDGAEIKVTFKTRFHRCVSTNDDGGIDGDIERGSEDATQLNGEMYRTLENAVRQFLKQQADPTYTPPRKIGDCAANGNSFLSNSGDPFGAIYLDMVFVKLLPLVHEDGNDDMDEWDTKIRMDSMQLNELYARAVSEAYLDGTTTLDYACTHNVAAGFDFSWENINYEAHGGTGQSVMPLRLRPDGMSGYSALPSTIMYAEVFNRLAKVWNLMTRLRLMLPFNVFCEDQNYIGSQAVTPLWPSGAICYNSASQMAVWSGQPPSASTPTNELSDPSEWPPCTVLAARSYANLSNNCGGIGGTQFMLESYRTAVHYEVRLTDPTLVDALPPDIQALLAGQSLSFIARRQTLTAWLEKEAVESQADAQYCDAVGHPDTTGFFWVEGEGGWKFNPRPTSGGETTDCVLMAGAGVLDAGTPPSSDFYAGRNAFLEDCDIGESARFISLEPIDSWTVFLEIPLYD